MSQVREGTHMKSQLSGTTNRDKISNSSKKRFFDVPLDQHPEEPPEGCDHLFRTCESVRWCDRCGWQGSDPTWKEYLEPARKWWQVWK